MYRLIDQIVANCTYLSNFQPALVPTPKEAVSDEPTSSRPPSPVPGTSQTTTTRGDISSSDVPISLSELELSSCNSEDDLNLDSSGSISA